MGGCYSGHRAISVNKRFWYCSLHHTSLCLKGCAHDPVFIFSLLCFCLLLVSLFMSLPPFISFYFLFLLLCISFFFHYYTLLILFSIVSLYFILICQFRAILNFFLFLSFSNLICLSLSFEPTAALFLPSTDPISFSVFLQLPLLALALIQHSYRLMHTLFNFCGSLGLDCAVNILINRGAGEAERSQWC